jgi:LPXTG-motif cell wall-anchored protein
LKKLMMLAALLAMVLVAAAPALAQVAQGIGVGESESGDVEPELSIANKGDNASLCTAVLQTAQTGNVQNAQGVNQYAVRESDEIEFEGSNITISPELAAACEQTIEQAAAAGEKAEAKAGKAEAKAGPAEAKAGKAEAKAGEAEAKAAPAEAKAGKAEAKAGEKKELPKTGGSAGSASLLALGAGALLVGGGLLARRIIR